MLYNEQKLFKKTRSYYHGATSINSNEKNSNFPWFFITTSFMYAIIYARKTENNFGVIYKYHLNNEINIFNAQSNYDFLRLKKSLNVSAMEWDEIESIIFYQDWALLGESLRNKIANTLKNLGYQVFFNFELTRDSDCTFEYNEYYTVSPSIGLFDLSCLTKTETLTPDEFEK